jgi:Cd2+/Zn2+-exporting ATPase
MTEKSNSAQIYTITGMDCADCAKSIERGVSKLDGVTACAINFAAATLKVEGNAAPSTVIQRVRELGYDVQTQPSTVKRQAETTPSFLQFLLQRRDTTLALIGAVLILPGLVLHELLPLAGIHLQSPIPDFLSLAALFVAGFPIARSAWRAITVNREVTINVLMTIAAVGAVVIGAYTEAGLVMVLFAIGEALEGYTSERARNSIRSLMQVAPSEATRLASPDSPEARVPVSELRVGDVILVKPGERIPMDGRIVKGTSAINQAPITGESVPVEKRISDEVFAGTINGEGVLEVEVTQLAEDNTISRIIKLVEEASENKAPAERFVDQFAKVYTPAVVVVAILVGSVPPLLFGAPFWGEQGWLYRALELLVVACPCALVISTPVAIISAISNAARNGVLIKGGAYLETLASVNQIAFDKTGTLTEGKPTVVAVRSVNCTEPREGTCVNCADLLALADAVERRSEHPLARAIVAAADAQHTQDRLVAAEDVKAIVGKGVSGNVNGRTVFVGSHGYFDVALPHVREVCAEIDAAAAKGQTPMLVGVGGEYQGYITVADTVRESSRVALAELKRVGVLTLMLTGDAVTTARHIAAQLGVDEVHAGLMPQDKLALIQSKLANPKSKIAMVGDGVNDAPALAAASVGIAMGAGTAQALETADVALMSDDLSKLPFALRLAKRAMRTIRTNIAFAIGIKLVFLALVLMGLGTMWLAVLADVGATLIVTLNGMRLLRTQT